MNDYLILLETYSCVILKNNEIIFTSKERGVKPLLDYYHQYQSSEEPVTIIDKIIGRGAIILAKMINAQKIITPIVSKEALNLANLYHINVEYQELVEYIVNRDQTGRCPIENSVLSITNLDEGYRAILQAIDNLMK